MRTRLYFLAIFLLVSNLYSNTNTKIIQQSRYLGSKGRLEKRIVKKLNNLANDIVLQEKRLNYLKKKMNRLDLGIKSNEVDIEQKYKKLTTLVDNNKQLSSQKKDLQEKIIKTIAKDLSYYLISGKDYIETKDTVVADVVVKKLNIILNKQLRRLSKSYENVNTKISVRTKEIKYIKSRVDNFQKQKQKLLNFKKQKIKAIKKLSLQKKNYRYKLYKIKKEKIAIQQTLEKLKILSRAETIKTRKQRQFKTRHSNKLDKKLNVRQIGSSYQASRVRRYRGKKTIAPLDRFVVKRKFGNYIDPIYHIKIFNNSITLASKIPNAKVRNILNGKVVFAKDTAVLDKVIIIENAHGIHTIYAHLSKIAPTIRVGKKIRKGYIIGRVDNDLTFEVTQKNYHINPLQLIN